jgi:TRAP-type mannitol/chloroaromatic compound transport system permease small subunit
MVMVAAGILLLIQGIAQVMRCIYCIKNGDWLNAEDDIEETEVILMRAAENSEDLSSIKDR